MPKLILFNKPFQVLSQFTASGTQPGYGSFLSAPECAGYYPAGRLDYDSEGLLILTDDGSLQHRIAHPDQKLPKTYWAQVEGTAQATQIERLQKGLILNDGPTKPARVKSIATPALWPRTPPVRTRQQIPTSWIELTLTEGRNRQVRRMTAAVGLPTLRLIRVSIGPWSLGRLQPGEFLWETVNMPRTPKSTTRPRTSFVRRRPQ